MGWTTCVRRAIVCLALLLLSTVAAAQDPPTPADQINRGEDVATPSWMFMYDGVLFATFNRQSGPRGETQFRSQNWLMLMASRPFGNVRFTVSGMFSAEPATVTARGYSHLFQTGEAFQGLENTDRQHPHDLFAQLALVMRVPLGDAAGLTLAAAPVGEATLGPVGFMHRASAAENPSSPLGHHTLDSTHIANGVVALGVDVGPWILEGSVFRGREPDENRWNLDTGRLDSVAARLWFRPSTQWVAQASYGFLKGPEQLIPGDVRRTTASLSWTPGPAAISGMYGHNKRQYSDTSAWLAEATVTRGADSVYGRVEVLQIETEHLLFTSIVHQPHPKELIDWLQTFTVGAVHDLWTGDGHASFGLGGDVGFYGVPDRLRPFYGPHPVSFHVFLRVRPPVGHMGRMWNTTMMQPMAGHGMK